MDTLHWYLLFADDIVLVAKSKKEVNAKLQNGEWFWKKKDCA